MPEDMILETEGLTKEFRGVRQHNRSGDCGDRLATAARRFVRLPAFAPGARRFYRRSAGDRHPVMEYARIVDQSPADRIATEMPRPKEHFGV